MRLVDAISGHLFTLAPVVQEALRPAGPLPGKPFEAIVHDDKVGDVRVTGFLSALREGAPLLVIVHGLGGSVASPYMGRLARLAHREGLDTLLLNLRGADRSGEDIYHAGLTADLDAALASPALRDYRSIVILGCSMGGHMVLRWGFLPSDGRVRAIGSLCAPLDLKQGARDIDAPERVVYRKHLLKGLKEIYASAHARKRVSTALDRVNAVRTIRAWDELAVVPRFGFDSAEHYWHETEVAPHLSRLAIPTRVVAAKHDPMVLARALAKYLSALPSHVHVDWVDGGHLGFPWLSRAEADLVHWLGERAREGENRKGAKDAKHAKP